MIAQSNILVVSKNGILGNIFSALKDIDIILSSSIEVYTFNDFDLISQRINELTILPSLIIFEASDDDSNKSAAFLGKIKEYAMFMHIPVINVHTATDWDETELIEIIRAKNGDLEDKICGEVDKKEMILIPAGKYKRRRGLSPTYLPLEADQQIESHTGAYYIDKYPVTNAEYEQFILSSQYPYPHHWKDGRFPEGKHNHPVTGVNWNDVLQYAKWAKKRVLSPDEWEKAAFGEGGVKYPWGDDLELDRCNVAESNQGGTTPVDFYCEKGGNSCYGVSDLIGNVWEWVYDWTAASDNRMLMGGAWDTPRGLLEAPNYARVRANPQLRGMNFGFRLAISLEICLRNRCA